MFTKEDVQDMNQVSKDLKKLDKNSQIIATSVVACLLARQKMEELLRYTKRTAQRRQTGNCNRGGDYIPYSAPLRKDFTFLCLWQKWKN